MQHSLAAAAASQVSELIDNEAIRQPTFTVVDRLLRMQAQNKHIPVGSRRGRVAAVISDVRYTDNKNTERAHCGERRQNRDEPHARRQRIVLGAKSQIETILNKKYVLWNMVSAP